MAKAEYNSCAGLVDDTEYTKFSELYDELQAGNKDAYQTLLDLQNLLQVNLVKRLPERNIEPFSIETKGELVDWLRKQKDCIDDEFRELITSVGGMSTGAKNASSVWKDWKAKNIEVRNERIVDMSSADKLEMLFEMVDIMHFVNNMLLGLKMTSKDLFILYCIKNKENFNRHDNGY